MKLDTDLGWELIEHDPILRLELNSIEQHNPGDEMVAELMEFYARIERMMNLTTVIIQEVEKGEGRKVRRQKTRRLEDCEAVRV